MMPATHKQWQDIIAERDAEARRAVRALREDRVEDAKIHAVAWDVFDDEAARIAHELDFAPDRDR
jgi:ABC-type sugar transport system substrate-binding protein